MTAEPGRNVVGFDGNWLYTKVLKRSVVTDHPEWDETINVNLMVALE